MFAQQESSLLVIFRGMPKQVPAYTALLFSGQTFSSDGFPLQVQQGRATAHI